MTADAHMAAPEPKPISAPANFPVAWADPSLAMLPWMQDRMHAPEPMTPMSFWFAQNGFAVGTNIALTRFDAPVRFNLARINTYYYMAIAPHVPPEEIHAIEERIAQTMPRHVATFASRWDAEWLPELKSTWAKYSAIDGSKLSMPDLLKRLDDLLAIYIRAWDIHFSMLMPAFVGFGLFKDMHNGLLGGDSQLSPYKLLQGLDSMSLEVGRALWTLSRAARADPALHAIIESTTSGELRAALGTSPAGQGYLAKVDAFLAQYGKRSDTVQELADPSWTDDATPVFNNIKSYMKQEEDPDAAHQKLASERERLLAQARERLKNHPEEARGGFEFMLQAAQNCTRLQEDHNFWIDQRGLHENRQLCLEFGRRFVTSGTLATVDDVFMLTVPELRDIAGGKAPTTDWKRVASERRAELERWRKVAAPPALGTDYGPPPDDPLNRAMGLFWGAPPPAPTAALIKGNAGSAGKVRAVARVIMHIGDGGRLGQGEILVAPTTAPPWTPLFATAGGIVTDTGGPLSHCAIVAREYGIPAVVGTGRATAVIKDGQMLEVDGDKGEVRIVG